MVDWYWPWGGWLGFLVLFYGIGFGLAVGVLGLALLFMVPVFLVWPWLGGGWMGFTLCTKGFYTLALGAVFHKGVNTTLSLWRLSLGDQRGAEGRRVSPPAQTGMNRESVLPY